MKKGLLMSGECRIGHIGEETKLLDFNSEKLYSGDLVSLSVYNEDFPHEFSDFCGVQYVCNNEFQDDGLEKYKYIMGIACEHKEYEDGFGETIVYQNHKRWRIRKVKGYEKLVHGEIWGAVRVEFED